MNLTQTQRETSRDGRSRIRFLPLVLASLAWPATVFAHAPGGGALGFRSGPRFGRAVLFGLPVAWIAGSVAGLLVAPQLALPAATAAMTVALGALVAADMPLPLASVAGLAIALGLLNGGLDGIELARVQSSVLGVAGVPAVLFVVVSLSAGLVTSVRAPWGRVMVRVVGSWVASSGLFMLGWSMRGV